MFRVSTLRVKLLVLLVLSSFLAPFIASAIARDIAVWQRYTPPAHPDVAWLVILGVFNLVVPFVALGLLRRFIAGTRRDALLAPIAIAIVSSTGWLVLQFFLSGLEGLQRTFIAVHVMTLVLLLWAARVAIRVPIFGKLTAISAAAAVAFFGFGGRLPVLQADGQSFLERVTEPARGFLATIHVGDPDLINRVTQAASALINNVAPVIAALSLLLAGVVGRWVQLRYMPVQPSSLGRLRDDVVWICITLLVWLGGLFAFGALADVPRWLPLAAAVAMLLVGLGRYARPLMIAVSKPARILDLVLDTNARSDDPLAAAELVPPTAMTRNANGRVAWIISMTGVSGEPRVLRQAEALTAEGWRVVVCGFDGRSERPRSWHFVRMPTRTPFSSRDHNTANSLHNTALRLVQFGRGSPLFRFAAHWAHSTNVLWYHIRRELVRVAKETPELKADLVIAHDYHTSDMGYEVARVFNAQFSIDVHEYAREQYSNDPEWVKKEQPVIVAVQDHYLRRADLITVVCAGIGELLAKETSLKRAPVTIRNVPFNQPQTFRPTGSRIRVLYHGDLSRHRYIHDLVKSMASWRSDFDLVLRGSGDVAYIADLKRSVSAMGLDNRVFFEPPVPFNQIIPAANSADIGLFSYEAYSPQIRLALPNKLFEYIMAGLAVCITKLDEAGRVVQHYNVGKLIPQHSPASIAETINSFTVGEIDEYKKASLKAAEELNWDAEKQKLLSAYQSLFV
jgi:glycogen synthase